MTTRRAQTVSLLPAAGVRPSTDGTASSVKHWVSADKIRFVGGRPEKIGGWSKIEFENDDTITGTSRSIYGVELSNAKETLIGTHQKLYSVVGQSLVNITPLVATPVAAANSLATHYATLGSDPISTTDGSLDVVISDSEAELFEIGDTVTLSGATATGGIDADDLNTSHIIRSIGTDEYTVRVASAATSTATGGGASVVRASGLITLTKTTHGLLDGERVLIADAATSGGIADIEINSEFIIRNKTTDTFDFMTEGTATSSVSSAGGASTTYQEEIASGALDESVGQGYGMGRYGTGLYGVAKISTSGRRYPRIWFMDRFGDTVIATAGNQTGVYAWANGDEATAPVLLENAPTAVNYAFVYNNIVITFGANDVPNRIKTSDIAAPTVWTASSTNQVYEDDIEGAGRLISHLPAGGTLLIFTENQTWIMRYLGLPLIWQFELLDPNIGLIGPMAKVSVRDVAFWMGQNNFYYWDGSGVQIIPSNDPAYPQSTILNYVFSYLNTSQKSKIFAWYNEKFNEVWWHYPSAASMEPDRIARLSLADFSWAPDTMERTAAEYPHTTQVLPRLINENLFYRHETGYDDDGAALAFSLVTPNRKSDAPKSICGLIPDSDQEGSITVSVVGKLFPQSATNTFSKSFTIPATTGRVTTPLMNGRVWNYSISGNTLGQHWKMGDWYEQIQEGPRQ